jgi:ribosomal-protein-alanine N-acetyltransferase
MCLCGEYCLSPTRTRYTGIVIRLRDYSNSDFEELYKLDQKCFEPGIAYSRAELSSYVARKESFTIVAEESADAANTPARKPRIVGFVTVEMHPKGYGHIITIDTHPDLRRQKLGSTLIEAAEKYVRDKDGFMVVLEVAVNNLAAITFYKRHHYSVLRKLPKYYLGKTDGLFLTKRL